MRQGATCTLQLLPLLLLLTARAQWYLTQKANYTTRLADESTGEFVDSFARISATATESFALFGSVLAVPTPPAGLAAEVRLRLNQTIDSLLMNEGHSGTTSDVVERVFELYLTEDGVHPYAFEVAKYVSTDLLGIYIYLYQ